MLFCFLWGLVCLFRLSFMGVVLWGFVGLLDLGGCWGGVFLGILLVLLFFFHNSIHVLLFIFYSNILEAGNWLLIKWHLVLSSWVTLLGFFSSPPFTFSFLYLLKKNSFSLFRAQANTFFASLMNDAIICHQRGSKPRLFRKTCQGREHKWCSSTATGHKYNRSIHKLWLLFVCFSLSWQQYNDKHWLAREYCTWDYKKFKKDKIAYFSPQNSFKLIHRGLNNV